MARLYSVHLQCDSRCKRADARSPAKPNNAKSPTAHKQNIQIATISISTNKC